MIACRPFRYRWLATVLFVMIWAFPASGWADLKFCNRTASHALVAVAYVQKDAPGTTTNQHRGVTVEGWWRFEPNECASVTNIDDAGSHWVYYHAHSPSNRWDGDARLCVASRPFKNGAQFKRQGEACPAGYHLEGFRRSSANTRNYTINLR